MPGRGVKIFFQKTRKSVKRKNDDNDGDDDTRTTTGPGLGAAGRGRGRGGSGGRGLGRGAVVVDPILPPPIADLPASPSDKQDGDGDEDGDQDGVEIEVDQQTVKIVPTPMSVVVASYFPSPASSSASVAVAAAGDVLPGRQAGFEKEETPASAPMTLGMTVFLKYLNGLISPTGCLDAGKWNYKFTSVEEVEGVLESVVLFVSAHPRQQGIKLFGDENLAMWRILGSESTSPFFTSLSSTVRNNLVTKCAKLSEILKPK